MGNVSSQNPHPTLRTPESLALIVLATIVFTCFGEDWLLTCPGWREGNGQSHCGRSVGSEAGHAIGGPQRVGKKTEEGGTGPTPCTS